MTDPSHDEALAHIGRAVLKRLDLSAAKVGSRELDEEVCAFMQGATREVHGGRSVYHRGNFWVSVDVQPVTQSIDAALALVELKRPNLTIDITKYRENGGEFPPSAIAKLSNPYGEMTEYRGRAPTPALAIISALLASMDDLE